MLGNKNKKFVEKGSLVDEFRVNDLLMYLSSSSFGPAQDVVSNTRSSTSIRVDLCTEYIYVYLDIVVNLKTMNIFFQKWEDCENREF